MAETNKLLEETANYLLSHCFLLGGVEDQRSKYLYVQDHLNEVRAVFAPLGYAVLLYPAPLQAAALVNEHEGSQARLLKYESILLLVLRLARPVGRLSGLDSRIVVFPTVLLALPDADLADAAAESSRTRNELALYERPEGESSAEDEELSN